MRIKPILFNTEMVKAILDGRKTVTRRVVKPQPPAASIVSKIGKAYGWSRGKDSQPKYLMKQPYQTGDVLWVRETWCEVMGRKGKYLYRAYAGERDDTRDYVIALNTWRPSIHMPREAARIFLRVTGVRAERLHEIATIEAQQEGQPECTGGIMACGGQESCFDCEASYQNAIRWFSSVWDSTIKPADRDRYGWNANPWVWVIEFERCEKPKEWGNV